MSPGADPPRVGHGDVPLEPPIVLRTERLVLRRFVPDDAAFILEHLNEPAWLRFIGDRNVHSLEAARGYIERGPMMMYARRGFGLYRVELGATGEVLGMCGLIKRDALEDVDIGFSLLARHAGKGYAFEAAAGTVRHAREDLRLRRLAAIVNADNIRSIALLEKLGMCFERMIRLPGEDVDIRLYGMELGGN
jgi:RimJ/RimL family protein N-acetyltransferase